MELPVLEGVTTLFFTGPATAATGPTQGLQPAGTPSPITTATAKRDVHIHRVWSPSFLRMLLSFTNSRFRFLLGTILPVAMPQACMLSTLFRYVQPECTIIAILPTLHSGTPPGATNLQYFVLPERPAPRD